MNKFAIVGCEASGKTVFMSALCDCFRDTLVPENAAANRFARFASRQLRALRQWPPATPPEKAVELNFTLREDGRVLAELGLLEFGGETFRAAFRDDESEPAHKRAVKDLLAFLGDADFILVLVSLQELFRNPGDTPLADFERDTESIWVTRGLLEFIRDQAPTANVAIGLTQADRYAKELADLGGPARTLASRWPSIRAVAPDLPVLAIASVSGTDDEGRPREGFTTDGILPALREFATRQFGSPAELTVSLAALKTELDAALADRKTAGPKLSEITRKTKRLSGTLDALKAIGTLTRDPLSSEIAAADEACASYERAVKELRAQAPKRKPPRRKVKGRPTVRRTLLLALLLASVILFADRYRPYAIGSANPECGTLPCPQKVETAALPTQQDAASTNAAPVAVTNAQPVAVTNAVPVAVTNAASVVVTNELPFRVWHDHRGKAIEARWIGTSTDQKAITLETRSGKRLRAVLYKFSEEDRAFVQEQLEKKRP